VTTAFMSTAWGLYVLLVGGLLAIGAASFASVLRLAGRPSRWMWVCALIALAALTVTAPTARMPDIDGSIRSARAAPSQHVAMTVPNGPLASLRHARDVLASDVAHFLQLANDVVPRSVMRSLGIAWTLTSVALFALYLMVNVRLARLRRRWPNERLHGAAVRIAPATGPAVIGFLQAEIVVPRAVLQRSADEQRLILAHEREHLRAHDHLLLALGCLLAIALPWHPAVWYLLARLRLAIELDCDARVLSRGAAPQRYGALLIDMAARGAGFRIGALALADRPSHLERRLLAMKRERSRYAVVRGAALSSAAGLLVLAACETKVPTAREMSSMKSADGAKSVTRSDVSFGLGNADVFVNGVKVSRDSLNAIVGSRIFSLDVVKGKRDTVFITTNDKVELRGLRPFMKRTNQSDPQVIIDGVVSSESALEALKPNEISEISSKGPTPALPGGAIVVTTTAHADGAAHQGVKLRVSTPE